MTSKEAIKIATGLRTDFKCESDTMVDFCNTVIKALEQEPSEDCISRQSAINEVKKNTFRLTFAEEQGCEGHVAWSAEAIYSDVIEGALLELPPVTPTREQEPCEDAISREYVIEELNKINGTEEIFKVHEIIENAPSVQPKRIKGEWIESKYSEICSECKAPILCDNNEYVVYSNYCPNCGAKMESEEEV